MADTILLQTMNARAPLMVSKTPSSRQRFTCSCRANYNELSMQKKKKKINFYQVLSLQTVNVGFEDIKRAYRSMALQHHPDVRPSSEKQESTERFLELREAYEVLSDPISRTRYDYEMGLISSIGFGFHGLMEEKILRRNNFQQAVWEKQLYGLNLLSNARMEKKKKKKINNIQQH